MQKEKKITVKHFLNKKLPYNPDQNRPVKKNSSPRFIFPVYVQVTYDRKNTQFKSTVNNYYESLEEIEPADKETIENEKESLIRIISFESKVKGDQFSLRGLNEHLLFFLSPVSKELENKTRFEFYTELNQVESEYKYIIINYEERESNLLEIKFDATKKLIPEYSFKKKTKANLLIIAYKSYKKLNYFLIEDVKLKEDPKIIDFLEDSNLHSINEKYKCWFDEAKSIKEKELQCINAAIEICIFDFLNLDKK